MARELAPSSEPMTPEELRRRVAVLRQHSAYSTPQLDMMEAELARVSQGRAPDSVGAKDLLLKPPGA